MSLFISLFIFSLLYVSLIHTSFSPLVFLSSSPNLEHSFPKSQMTKVKIFLYHINVRNMWGMMNYHMFLYNYYLEIKNHTRSERTNVQFFSRCFRFLLWEKNSSESPPLLLISTAESTKMACDRKPGRWVGEKALLPCKGNNH